VLASGWMIFGGGWQKASPVSIESPSETQKTNVHCAWMKKWGYNLFRFSRRATSSSSKICSCYTGYTGTGCRVPTLLRGSISLSVDKNLSVKGY
jgi:hypothetical protein